MATVSSSTKNGDGRQTKMKTAVGKFFFKDFAGEECEVALEAEDVAVGPEEHAYPEGRVEGDVWTSIAKYSVSLESTNTTGKDGFSCMSVCTPKERVAFLGTDEGGGVDFCKKGEPPEEERVAMEV